MRYRRRSSGAPQDELYFIADVAPSTVPDKHGYRAKAAEMKVAGHDAIGLGAGESDFKTPSHIIEAAMPVMKRAKGGILL